MTAAPDGVMFLFSKSNEVLKISLFPSLTENNSISHSLVLSDIPIPPRTTTQKTGLFINLLSPRTVVDLGEIFIEPKKEPNIENLSQKQNPPKTNNKGQQGPQRAEV